MADTLAQHLAIGGRDVNTVAAWIQQQIGIDSDRSWEQNMPAIRKAWENIGDAAYGVFNRGLFDPMHDELERHDLICTPRLPGSMKLSEEEWGPEDHRERRMWTLLVDRTAGDAPLGALVVRFFHDHTELRLPALPTMVGLDETDHDRIRDTIVQDPATWDTGSR